MQEKLKPCPFCGGNEFRIHPVLEVISVHCCKCGIDIILPCSDISVWNKRADKIK